jgi:dTDP-4-amino-4,6-dideoxygalactose transaminase
MIEPGPDGAAATHAPAAPPPAPADRVPFVTLDRQHEPLMPTLRAAFERVVASSGFILGAEVEAFEADFAAYCGVGHCAGVASGTAAIRIALLAAGIGPGDEVIVPGHTFIASALGVLHAGATPVFADVDAGTGLLDPGAAAQVITPRTAAIMPVHLYGQVCDMARLNELARRHGLFVLEDAAQAHGAADGERRAGALGDAAAFSFYPSKNLGALGDGGAICTADAGLAERARELRHLGQRGKGHHVEIGANERLDGMQAAFLRAKLPHLDRWNEARRSIAELYDRLIGPDPATRVLVPRPGSRCVYHLYPIRVADRDATARRLDDAGIATGIHYHPAAHRHPAFDRLPAASRPVSLPVADAWAQQELSLPMAPELTVAEVRRVVLSLASKIAQDSRV